MKKRKKRKGKNARTLFVFRCCYFVDNFIRKGLKMSLEFYVIMFILILFCIGGWIGTTKWFDNIMRNIAESIFNKTE